MLDGRTIIEVPSRTDVHPARFWLVNYARHGVTHSRVTYWAVRTLSGDWFTRNLDLGNQDSMVRSFASLRDVRRYLFRGNGRLLGGHPEITGAVLAPMSLVHVAALCDPRTAPGGGDY